MQITGTNCNVCKAKIIANVNGVGCLNCNIIFHKSCIEDSLVCPNCSLDFNEQISKAKSHERSILQQEQKTGKKHVIMACIIVLINAILSLPEISPVVSFAITCTFIFYYWKNKTWAKFILCLEIILQIFAYTLAFLKSTVPSECRKS